MTFHIPSIEAAEAVASVEVAAAKDRGLYATHWGHKATPGSGMKKGQIAVSTQRRKISARLAILRHVFFGTERSTDISAALGKTQQAVITCMKLMRDEGLIELHRDRCNSPTRATITPAGRDWLAAQGGDA